MSPETDSYRPTVLDLFGGPGGISLGFRQAGYRIVAGTDSIEALTGRRFIIRQYTEAPGAESRPHGRAPGGMGRLKKN